MTTGALFFAAAFGLVAAVAERAVTAASGPDLTVVARATASSSKPGVRGRIRNETFGGPIWWLPA